MLCQCYSQLLLAYFSYDIQTPQGHALQSLKKKNILSKNTTKKKRHTLGKYQNYLFKCPTFFRLSDVLIVSWQMVDRPNTLFHLQDCLQYRITILWSTRMYHTCRRMYLVQLSSWRSALGLETCTYRRYREN